MTKTSRAVMIFAKGYVPTPGGLETYSEQVAHAYARAGFDVEVRTQVPPTDGFPNEQEHVRVRNVGAGSQLTVFARLALMTLKSRRRFDLVHATTWRVALVPALLMPRTWLVISVHGREVMNGNGLVRLLRRWVFSRADQVLCISVPTLRQFEREVRAPAATRAVVAWNGLTPALTVGQRVETGESTNIFTLARLVPRKGIIQAVQAIALLPDELRVKVRYRVAGRGPLLGPLAAEIKRLRLEGIVELLGYVSDAQVIEEYRKAGIFLHPHSNVGEGNDFEGFGIVIADAMFHRCAPVVGRDGGPSDFITDGENGVLVDGTAPADIAAKLSELLTDGAVVRNIAEVAEAFAQREFTWDRHLASTIAAADAASDRRLSTRRRNRPRP